MENRFSAEALEGKSNSRSFVGDFLTLVILKSSLVEERRLLALMMQTIDFETNSCGFESFFASINRIGSNSSYGGAWPQN
jgi:hypothetical protein